MALVSPTSLIMLPTPPNQGDILNFASRADTFILALQPLQTEFNAQNIIVYNNAVYAYDQGVLATTQVGLATAQVALATAQVALATTQAEYANTSALAAAASAGASIWVSGSNYTTIGTAVWSPNNRIVYRLIATISGSTNAPESDPTHWAPLGTLGLQAVIVSGTSVTAVTGTHYILTNAATTTVTLPASPNNMDIVWVTVTNSLLSNIIARNGQTIMGIAEDMLIDNQNATVELRFVNSSWRLV